MQDRSSLKRRLRAPFIRYAGLLLLCAGAAHADDIDDLVRTQMLAHHIPGLSLAVVSKGAIAREGGFGTIAVTATSLQTGGPTTFSNHLEHSAHRRSHSLRAVQQRLGPEHIMASGALPPGFAPVTIDDCAYWDGGLFSNTKFDALLNLLHPDEIDSLPIFTIDLFATRNLPMPQNLLDVQTRALALQYENRFWAEYGGEAGPEGFTAMLRQLERELPADSSLRHASANPAANPAAKHPDNKAAVAWQWLQRLRALANVHVIEGAPAAAGGDHDFSAYAVKAAYEAGRAAAGRYAPSEAQAAKLRAVA